MIAGIRIGLFKFSEIKNPTGCRVLLIQPIAVMVVFAPIGALPVRF